MAWATVTFNKNGGTGGTNTLYVARTGTLINGWYTQQKESSTYRVYSLAIPTKTNCRFVGYYAESVTGTPCYCDSSGNLYNSVCPTTTVTATARWVDDYNTLTINRNGGTGGTSKIYRRKADGICFSEETLATQITSITPPMREDYAFAGISYNGTLLIDRDGNILPAMASASITADVTLPCSWTAGAFGYVNDYFNLGNANLVASSSDNGATLAYTHAYNATTSATATDNEIATDEGGILMNPTVTYQVVGNFSLNVILGSAFAGMVNSQTNAVTKSGYMVTGVTIETSIGNPPTVTVNGTANEGYVWDDDDREAMATPSVKTYSVTIPLSCRHRPQILLNAFTGGGDLQRMTMKISCDPVVLSENNMPCASDVCHGRIEIDATLNAYDGEDAPTASNGFTLVGQPMVRSGIGYKTWNVSLRKELT